MSHICKFSAEQVLGLTAGIFDRFVPGLKRLPDGFILSRRQGGNPAFTYFLARTFIRAQRTPTLYPSSCADEIPGFINIEIKNVGTIIYNTGAV
jgi:hypothetical protein